MVCDFTEEVSLLIDGELPPHEAARLGAHVEGCAACQQAREAFLLLRQGLRSYDLVPDTHAQSRALAAILGSRAAEAETATTSAGARAGRPATPRGMFGLPAGSLANAFGGGRLRPAHVATLALLLIGTVLGVRWLTSSYNSSPTHQPGAPLAANANSLPAQATAVAEGAGKESEDSDAVSSPVTRQAKRPTPPRPGRVVAMPPGARRQDARVNLDGYRVRRQRREGLSRIPRQELALVVEPASRPSTAVAVAPYAGGVLGAAADPALRVGRQAERVERLFRSFRNARLTESDPTFDVADARRLSRRLLYSNIALRREAASAGDLPVEGLLGSLEPILIDISNLPNAPSADAVGSIKERIRRQQLVGVLQAQVMLATP